jgi:hypothetical protein
MDAVLALIPVFIVLASVSTISYEPSSSHQLFMERIAQDSLEVLLIETEYAPAMLEEYLVTSNVTEIQEVLNRTTENLNYMLERKNETSGWTYLCGRAEGSSDSTIVASSLANASNVVTAERILYNQTNGNITMYTFKIHIWR